MLALNLLPWRERQRQAGIRRFQQQLLGVGLLAALMIGLADHWARQAQQRHVLDNASIRQVIERYDAQLAQVEQLKAEEQQVVQTLQKLAHLQGKRFQLIDLFEPLERAVPQGVYLTAVTRQGRRLQIRGLAQSGALVAQLLRNLSAVIGEADLQQVKAVDEGEAFELSVAMRGEP